MNMDMRVSLAKIQCIWDPITEKSTSVSLPEIEEFNYCHSKVDALDLTRVDEPSQILLFTIHQCWYPVSDEVLLKVFSKISHCHCVEKIIQHAEAQFLVQFDSIFNARVAQIALNDQCIYDDCCRLQLQFVHQKVNEEPVEPLCSDVENSCDEEVLDPLNEMGAETSADKELVVGKVLIGEISNIEVSCLDEVEVPCIGIHDKQVEATDEGHDHVSETTKPGLSSTLVIKTHDMSEDSQEDRSCGCFQIFDPGIVTRKDGRLIDKMISTDVMEYHSVVECDPFWMPILTSSVESQMRFLLLKMALTSSPDLILDLADNPSLKHPSDGGYFIIRWIILRDYDGFNGPGNSQVAFTFTWSLVRDYDGFNGPGTLRTRCFLRGGQCYGIISIRVLL